MIIFQRVDRFVNGYMRTIQAEGVPLGIFRLKKVVVYR